MTGSEKASTGRQHALHAAESARIALLEAALALESDDLPASLGVFAPRLREAATDLDGLAGAPAGLLHDRLQRAATRIRRLLHALREPAELVPSVHRSAESLAKSLVALHPATAALAAGRSAASSQNVAGPPPAPAKEDRRWEARTPLCTAIGYQSRARFFSGFSGDVSQGGLFITTESPLPVGSTLTVSLVLPTGKQVLTEARVTWNRMPQENGEPPGMGVRFVTPATEAAVVAFAEQQSEGTFRTQ